MTNKTATRPSDWAAADDTPTPGLSMIGAYYGVVASDIGEDGDVVALGHVGRLRMLAALRRHARDVWGEPYFDVATDRISYRWVTNTGTDLDWCLVEAKPTDPGAFPVTWWVA